MYLRRRSLPGRAVVQTRPRSGRGRRGGSSGCTSGGSRRGRNLRLRGGGSTHRHGRRRRLGHGRRRHRGSRDSGHLRYGTIQQQLESDMGRRGGGCGRAETRAICSSMSDSRIFDRVRNYTRGLRRVGCVAASWSCGHPLHKILILKWHPKMHQVTLCIGVEFTWIRQREYLKRKI